MRQRYSKFALIYFITLGLTLVSCEGETHPVPNVPVNIVINLDLPSYQPLNAPGGWVYLQGGSKGIVLYRNFDEFVALERHPTYNSNDPCGGVLVDSLNIFELVDTCSGSRYSIQSGVVVQGPAKWPLRRYNTAWNGGFQVSVFN
jgi:nitrite reductase/ring-hydroxylating ferredoxin subunit